MVLSSHKEKWFCSHIRPVPFMFLICFMQDFLLWKTPYNVIETVGWWWTNPFACWRWLIGLTRPHLGNLLVMAIVAIIRFFYFLPGTRVFRIHLCIFCVTIRRGSVLLNFSLNTCHKSSLSFGWSATCNPLFKISIISSDCENN